MTVAEGVMIRPAVVADAEALADLHVDVWEDAYGGLIPDEVFVERRATITQRVEAWRRILSAASSLTTVAEQEEQLIGFASAGPADAEDAPVDQELLALYVRAACWGGGVGRALLTAALAGRPAFLWVLSGNDRAITFYEARGFEADGVERTDEYGTEVRMVRGRGRSA